MGALIALADWQDDAACREAPTEIFFPVAGDPETAHWVAMFCDLCPVRTECLEYALATRQRYGIWGGMTERQRRRILKQRNGAHPEMARAPRPRKQTG